MSLDPDNQRLLVLIESSPPWTGLAGLQRTKQLLRSIVATVAVLLVIAEIIVLFSGVSARYLFRKPLIWSDELAGIFFLCLAMLGSVVAFGRGEHMRSHRWHG
jgi:TRAP-type C4-dicarboxylate transport system permease small subunit